jgi:hypothetical protein
MFTLVADIVRDWAAARGFGSEVVVDAGPEARNQQLNFAAGFERIVVAPSEAPMQVVPAMRIGEDDDGRRQLLNVMVPLEVVFTAFDETQPYVHTAHEAQCFALWELAAQAMQHAYFGVHEWSSPKWSQPRKHMSHGAELVVTLSLNVPLFDVESPSATPSPVPGEPKPVT